MSNDFTLLLSIIVFLTAVSSAVGYVFLVRKGSVIDPAIQFIFWFSLFVLPLPIRVFQTQDIEGNVSENLHLLLPYLPKAVFLCAFSLPLFLLAYYSGFAKRIAARLPVPRTGSHARGAFVCLTAASLLLIGLLARDSGGFLSFILLGYNSTAEMYGKGYLAVGFCWLLIAPLFLLHRYATHRKRIDLLLFAGAAAILIAVNLVMGSRHAILYGGLAALLFWHHAVRPVSLKGFALIGVISFLALNVVGYLRGSRYESLSDYWEKTTSDYERQVSDSPDTMFYTLTNGEFVAPFETLPQMLMSVGGTINPQLGLTYLKAPLFFIPRAMFPRRPKTLTNWYMETFYGGGYELNQGRAFFFLSEGYLNFGSVGVFTTMIVWGLFLGAARHYVRRSKRAPGAVLLYALTTAFIFQCIAGDFASVLVGLPEQSLSAAAIGLWITNKGSKNLSVAA